MFSFHLIYYLISKTDWEIISLDRLDYSGNLNRLDNILSDLLIDAISLRSENNDNPTGCFVSGGIDSSIVASILKPEKLYTIFFDMGPDYDELDYAKIISKHIDRELTIVTANPSDFKRTQKKNCLSSRYTMYMD